MYFKYHAIRDSDYAINPVQPIAPSPIPHIFQYIASNARQDPITNPTHPQRQKYHRNRYSISRLNVTVIQIYIKHDTIRNSDYAMHPVYYSTPLLVPY